MAFVTYPLTGAGDVTIKIPTDLVVDQHYQYLKLTDGAAGSTLAILARETTPGSTDAGMVTRNIPSTGLAQLVTVGNPTTAVSVANPTTSVSLSSQHTVTVGNPTTAVNVANPTTSVSLSSQHTVTIGNPTTAVNVANPTTSVNVANPTTSVTLTSGSILGAGSTANVIGAVSVANPTTSVNVANPTTSVTVTSGTVLGAGSSANTLGAVALVAGTTANALGSVALLGGSTGNSLGAVALLSGSSANVLGQVAQGAGSSANFWFMQSIPFSSANLARSSVATTVDVSIVAANANRKALIIQNLTTFEIGLGFSTGAVTTAFANVDWALQPRGNQNDRLIMGFNTPLFTGPIRGISLGTTAVVSGVKVLEFT
jgi:hypothetical protein